MDDYLYAWQLIPLALFVAGWVLGGGWLFWRGLVKHSASRRVKYARGALTSLASGASGILVGAVVAYFFHKVSQKAETDLHLLGAIVAVPLGLLATYAISYSVMGLSGKETLKVATGPVLSTLALAGVLLAAVAPITCAQYNSQVAQTKCQRNIDDIDLCLNQLYLRSLSPPASLGELVKQNLLRSQQLHCPGNKDRQVGYFYLPPGKKNARQDKALVLCDFRGNHSAGRHVIFADWHIAFCTPEEFDQLLKLPVNAQFAKALQAEEGKQ